MTRTIQPPPTAAYPFTTEGLSDALQALGDTPNQVADQIHALGVRGKRGCETGCVIAEWAALTFPGCTAVMQVGGTAAHIEGWLRLNLPGGDSFEMQTPTAVTECAAAFDDGGYPDLTKAVPA